MSLQMYDWPQMADAYHEYWGLIRDRLREHGVAAPDEMTRLADEKDAWLEPDLVLSQTCGLPYRRDLHNRVTLIGTPNYAVLDCPPGYYRSGFVVRADDPRGAVADFEPATFAFNGESSQSGFAAPKSHCAHRGFWFDNRRQSGGHRNSARLVAQGDADIAALDAVSWRHLCEYDDFATGLRVLEWTEPTPGLPYIAAAGADQPTIFAAIGAAVAALSVEAQAVLGIESIEYIAADVYAAVPSP